ncbi:hypothetical protein PIB30_081392 [Stylosanthes scabra]|uniref:Transposase MuDR plant domain-containing protein n=1 Tax=Stylosanthes scabra TaxID=79078 RepID=A0ABU6XTH7_9FABA|nr:hypothetical protein [Stylosanthes scabra]
MFELHRRYGPREVMELLTEMETANVDAAGPSSSSQCGPGAIIAAPIRMATPESGEDDSDEDFVGNTDESSESSDGSEFVPESQARQDYDLDGGAEFRIGHRFSTREAVHMAVKNYNIRRASEYRVVESDPYKYVCRCKRYDAGCPWSLRVALRRNLGHWYVAGRCGGLVDRTIVWHRQCPPITLS